MGIRLTGFSSPIFGLEWEYTHGNDTIIFPSVKPGELIKVFISSKCGDNGKYDRVRKKLKEI